MEYEIDKPDLQLKCEWAVFPKGGESSICYCTDKKRAELIVKALEAFGDNISDILTGGEK